VSRIDGHGPERDPRAVAAGADAAERAVSRMLGQAALLDKAAEVVPRYGDGTIHQEIHTMWTHSVVPAERLGPQFAFAGEGADSVHFVCWDLPGQRRVFFIANEELLRHVVSDIEKYLAELNPTTEEVAPDGDN
jgi:hypothetical protein